MVWRPNCHWGHAVGDDLFSLRHRPVALAPGDGDDGIWTGSLVVDDTGTARIFYTSVVQPNIGIGRVRVARPEDDSWNAWSKGDVLVTPPDDLDVVAYRDPFVFRDGALWRMYVGAGLRDGTATALGYSSIDLETWHPEGIAAQRSTTEREPVWMGALWECPQLVDLGSRHVLVSSVWDADVLYYAGYGVGTYADGRFAADTWGRLTYGPSYYAPSFFHDAEGRPCLVFWMRGVADAEGGWSSAHSIPYVLGLDGDRLIVTPHPDLQRYRRLAEGQVVEGPVDILWDAGASGTLTVTDSASALVITATDDLVRVMGTGNAEMSCPRRSRDAVRVILDGPILELVVDGALLGSAIVPMHHHEIDATGSTQIHALVRA